MESIKILHISDLHIDQFDGNNEHLRRKYYREYVGKLSDKIRNYLKINYLVITGDFVHKGNQNNFSHAKTVIEYLANNIELASENIIVCIGNHDVSISEESTGNEKKSRYEYQKFSENFANANPYKIIDRGMLIKLKNNVWCLSLDSILGSNGKSQPGVIQSEEIDTIVNDFIIDCVPNDDLLIIASHYPFDKEFRSSLNSEEPDFENRHIWHNAYFLQERILNIRQKANTIWLCGDIHFPAQYSIGNYHHFIRPGRFGMSVNGTPTLSCRQAKMIIANNSDSPRVVTFNYIMEGHKDNPQGGFWDCVGPVELDQFPYRNQSFPSQTTLLDSNDQLSLIKNEYKQTDEQREQERVFDTTSKLDLINEDCQKRIMEIVFDKGLYNFGRFVTSKNEISLAWISVNQLLDDPSLFFNIIDNCLKWYDQKIRNILATKKLSPVFIGIDIWGSIMASQLSIKTGYDNYCFASRADGIYHTEIENINPDELFDIISGDKSIIILTDVISTGRTIRRVYEKINEVLKTHKQEDKIWTIISIICDKNQPRFVDLSFISYFGTFCNELRIPVISKELLPMENILPPKVDYTK